MSAVADEVTPDYAGKVVFVDASADVPGGRVLAERFAVRYVPTSVFVSAEGIVVESHIGPMSAMELRARLDALVVSAE